MLALVATCALTLCPGHRPPLARSSEGVRFRSVVMQFDEEMGRRDKSSVPPAVPSAVAQTTESPVDDGANVERGVRALGFLSGGLVGNVILSVVEGLSGGGSAPGPPSTLGQAPIDDSGLYKAVLPLFESGLIPKLGLPGFLGGDTVRAVNEQANEKYKFMFPAAEPGPPAAALQQPAAEAAQTTTSSMPDDGSSTLGQLQLQQQPDGSAALSQLQEAGGSALGQLAAALSPLPQPAFAAVNLPGAEHIASSYAASSYAASHYSSLDDASLVIASGAGGVGLLVHLLVPLLFGLLGAFGFDVLSKQGGGAADAIKSGGKYADLAAQKLWATAQAAATGATSAAALGNTDTQEMPTRRRMPWEEDNDLRQ